MALIVMKIERNKGGPTSSTFRAYALEGQFIDGRRCDPFAAVAFPRDSRPVGAYAVADLAMTNGVTRAPSPYMTRLKTQKPAWFATEAEAYRYVSAMLNRTP